MKNNTHRIVLTGGPGGGKTTAADLIRRELGENVVIVPETATILFGGGFPRHEIPEAKVSAQKAIFHVQRNMEDVQRAHYPERILLCDRGTVDGAAYWPDGIDRFFLEMDTTLEKELTRYDAVIFFESAAVGDISIEGGNPVRNESNKKAIDLDGRLRAIWSTHPRFIHIPHQKSFFAKLKNAINAVEQILGHLSKKEQSP
jgi:hypothetical protein